MIVLEKILFDDSDPDHIQVDMSVVGPYIERVVAETVAKGSAIRNNRLPKETHPLVHVMKGADPNFISACRRLCLAYPTNLDRKQLQYCKIGSIVAYAVFREVFRDMIEQTRARMSNTALKEDVVSADEAIRTRLGSGYLTISPYLEKLYSAVQKFSAQREAAKTVAEELREKLYYAHEEHVPAPSASHDPGEIQSLEHLKSEVLMNSRLSPEERVRYVDFIEGMQSYTSNISRKLVEARGNSAQH